MSAKMNFMNLRKPVCIYTYTDTVKISIFQFVQPIKKKNKPKPNEK